MSVPAVGQLWGLHRLPSHQEAATSAAWGQPSLEGDKMQQSLNALAEKRRRRDGAENKVSRSTESRKGKEREG